MYDVVSVVFVVVWSTKFGSVPYCTSYGVGSGDRCQLSTERTVRLQ